jgi:ABC-type microcin C transport system permease subunit YejB
METLRSKVVKVLKREFTYDCTISSRMNQVILQVTNIDFEERLGRLLQLIQQIIDKYYPQREENLSIVIRDSGGMKENVFKIWKSVQ